MHRPNNCKEDVSVTIIVFNLIFKAAGGGFYIYFNIIIDILDERRR